MKSTQKMNVKARILLPLSMSNQFGLVETIYSVRRSNYSSMVLHTIKENFRCAKAFLLYERGDFFNCFPQI